MKAKKLAIVTDPETLDEQDTFFPFVNEALLRPHWELFTFDSQDLSYSGKTVRARRIRSPVCFENRKKLKSRKTRMKLEAFDVVFLKKDSPIDSSFTKLLKTLVKNHIPTVNDPRGILRMGTKSYLSHFPTLTPKTFFVHSVKDAFIAIRQMGNCVLKQSDSYGGKGVTHLNYKEGTLYLCRERREEPLPPTRAKALIADFLKKSRDHTLLVVRYLTSAIRRGDKRVVVLNGNILGSYIRLPNMKKGVCVCANNGAKQNPPTGRDREIVKAIRPYLEKNGIDLAALDLLADESGVERLSEINVVNPGFCNLDVVHPELHIAKRIMDMIQVKMA